MVSLITPSTVCKKVQNIAARIVTRSVRSSQITSVLIYLHWLSVKYRIDFKICSITHRALSLQCLHEPHYFSSLFSLPSNSYSLRYSSFSQLLLQYFNKKSHGFRSFSYAAPHLWNYLPNNVRYCNNLYMSKKKSKNLFFESSFPFLDCISLFNLTRLAFNCNSL